MAINLDYINIISQNEVMADLFNALMYKNFTSFIIEHSVYDYNYKPYFAAINVYPHYLPFFETLEQILTIPTSLTKNLQITPVTCDVLSTSIFQLDSNISNLWVYNNWLYLLDVQILNILLENGKITEFEAFKLNNIGFIFKLLFYISSILGIYFFFYFYIRICHILYNIKYYEIYLQICSTISYIKTRIVYHKVRLPEYWHIFWTHDLWDLLKNEILSTEERAKTGILLYVEHNRMKNTVLNPYLSKLQRIYTAYHYILGCYTQTILIMMINWIFRMMMAIGYGIFYVPVRYFLYNVITYSFFSYQVIVIFYLFHQLYLKMQKFDIDIKPLLYSGWVTIIFFNNKFLRFLFLDKNIYLVEMVTWLMPNFFYFLRSESYNVKLTHHYYTYYIYNLVFKAQSKFMIIPKLYVGTIQSYFFLLLFDIVSKIKSNNIIFRVKLYQFKINILSIIFKFRVSRNFNSIIYLLFFIFILKFFIIVLVCLFFFFILNFGIEKLLGTIKWQVWNIPKYIFYILFYIVFQIKVSIVFIFKYMIYLLFSHKWLWFSVFLVYWGLDLHFLIYYILNIYLVEPVLVTNTYLCKFINLYWNLWTWQSYSELLLDYKSIAKAVEHVSEFEQIRQTNYDSALHWIEIFIGEREGFGRGIKNSTWKQIYLNQTWLEHYLVLAFQCYWKYWKYTYLQELPGAYWCFMYLEIFKWWPQYILYNILSHGWFMYLLLYKFVWYYYVPYHYLQHSYLISFIFLFQEYFTSYIGSSLITWLFIVIEKVGTYYYESILLIISLWQIILIKLLSEYFTYAYIFETLFLEETNYNLNFAVSNWVLEQFYLYKDWFYIKTGYIYGDVLGDINYYDYWISEDDDTDDEPLNIFMNTFPYQHVNPFLFKHCTTNTSLDLISDTFEDIHNMIGLYREVRIHLIFNISCSLIMLIWLWLNLFPKVENYNYNSWYLWKALRRNELKDNFYWLEEDYIIEIINFYIDNKQNFMEDLNSLEQQSFNVFIKFLEVETIKLKETMKAMDDDDVIAILTKKANIINMFSEDFDKYFKTLDIKDKYALSKLKFSNFNAELIDSFFFDYTEFFFKKKYNNYFKVRMHHFSKLLLFLSLGCRHNEMIKALFMHHSDLVIYNMSFIEENTDTQKQIDYKFPEKVYEYFDKIDKHIFNYKGPNSLLSKDPSTSFVMIDKASEDTNEYFTSISSPWIWDGFIVWGILMPLMFLWLVFDVESGLVDPPRFITAPSWDLGLLLIYNYVAPSSLFKLYFLPEIYNFFFVKDVYNMNQPPRSEGILWWDIDIMLYNEPLKFYLYISNYYRVGIVANIYYYIGAWIYELCDYIIYPFKGDYWLIWIGRIKFLVFILFLTLYHKKPNYFSNYKVSYNVKTKIDLISIRYYYNIYTIKWINYFKLIKKNNNKIWF